MRGLLIYVSKLLTVGRLKMNEHRLRELLQDGHITEQEYASLPHKKDTNLAFRAIWSICLLVTAAGIAAFYQHRFLKPMPIIFALQYSEISFSLRTD